MAVQVKGWVKVGKAPVVGATVEVRIDGRSWSPVTKASGDFDVGSDLPDDLAGKHFTAEVTEKSRFTMREGRVKEGTTEIDFSIDGDAPEPPKPPTFLERIFGAACFKRDMYVKVVQDSDTPAAWGVVMLFVVALVAASALHVYLELSAFADQAHRSGPATFAETKLARPRLILELWIGICFGLTVTYGAATMLMRPPKTVPLHRFLLIGALSACPLMWSIIAPLFFVQTWHITDAVWVLFLSMAALAAAQTWAGIIAVQEAFGYERKSWSPWILGVINVVAGWGLTLVIVEWWHG